MFEDELEFEIGIEQSCREEPQEMNRRLAVSTPNISTQGNGEYVVIMIIV